MYHSTHLSSSDLISSEMSSCEATQFIIAATNQNALVRVARYTAFSLVAAMATRRFTVAQFK